MRLKIFTANICKPKLKEKIQQVFKIIVLYEFFTQVKRARVGKVVVKKQLNMYLTSLRVVFKTSFDDALITYSKMREQI